MYGYRQLRGKPRRNKKWLPDTGCVGRDAATDFLVWSDSFDRESADRLELQPGIMGAKSTVLHR